MDKTGDWFYQIVEISSAVIAGGRKNNKIYVNDSFLFIQGVLYLMTFKYEISYNADLDSIKFYYILPFTFILACLFHPSLNANFFGDVSWTFALYTESVAMMPQLYLFMKKA